MYDSLKEWMTCPFQIKPFIGYDAYADKEFGEPVDAIGYYVSEIEVVTDATGDDVVSSSQVYFDPSEVEIHSLDKIIVDSEEKDIIKITGWMDGNYGTSSIKIAYL